MVEKVPLKISLNSDPGKIQEAIGVLLMHEKREIVFENDLISKYIDFSQLANYRVCLNCFCCLENCGLSAFLSAFGPFKDTKIIS